MVRKGRVGLAGSNRGKCPNPLPNRGVAPRRSIASVSWVRELDRTESACHYNEPTSLLRNAVIPGLDGPRMNKISQPLKAGYESIEWAEFGRKRLKSRNVLDQYEFRLVPADKT